MKIHAGLFVLALVAAPALAFADDMKMDGAAADKALMESMQTMMRTMHSAPTGDADKDFVAMMIPHHQGAIDMAKIELQYGKDPMIRRLASEIVKAQEKEIAEMKAWQAGRAK